MELSLTLTNNVARAQFFRSFDYFFITPINLSALKHLFGFIFVILIVWSLGVHLARPESKSDVPVLYWMTDANPTRQKQVEAFHQWLERNDYPRMEVRLDTSQSKISKKLIQGVSGVASDIIDLNSDGVDFFIRIGLLQGMKEEADTLSFGTDQTYQSLDTIMTRDGEQYAFPCNANVTMKIINRAAFERIGMDPPPERWTFEEFEAIGREYVRRANEGLERQEYFFAANPRERLSMLRSMGGSFFNETMTRSTLDSPEYAQALSLLKKWVEVDCILPAKSDLDSISTGTGVGGQGLQMLAQGQYAMLDIGRYAIIQLRQMGTYDLDISEPPNGGYPNVYIDARMATVYRGTKYPDLAAYFLKFLASSDYNEMIVLDGDALPPNPLLTRSVEYRDPANYPNEKYFHEPFARAAETIGIADVQSPYVLSYTVHRIELDAYESCIADRATPEEAGKDAAKKINEEIQRALEEHPGLREKYEVDLAIQEAIDRKKAAGELIPAAWVSNPFYQKYYADMNLLEGTEDAE